MLKRRVQETIADYRAEYCFGTHTYACSRLQSHWHLATYDETSEPYMHRNSTLMVRRSEHFRSLF